MRNSAYHMGKNERLKISSDGEGVGNRYTQNIWWKHGLERPSCSTNE